VASGKIADMIGHEVAPTGADRVEVRMLDRSPSPGLLGSIVLVGRRTLNRFGILDRVVRRDEVQTGKLFASQWGAYAEVAVQCIDENGEHTEFPSVPGLVHGRVHFPKKGALAFLGPPAIVPDQPPTAADAAIVVPFGTLPLNEDVPVGLLVDGMSRHTAIIAQSGAGKTDAMGAVLEAVLRGTQYLRALVFDPNSDFAKFDPLSVRPAGGSGEPEESSSTAGAIRFVHTEPGRQAVRKGSGCVSSVPLEMRIGGVAADVLLSLLPGAARDHIEQAQAMRMLHILAAQPTTVPVDSVGRFLELASKCAEEIRGQAHLAEGKRRFDGLTNAFVEEARKHGIPQDKEAMLRLADACLGGAKLLGGSLQSFKGIAQRSIEGSARKPGSFREGERVQVVDLESLNPEERAVVAHTVVSTLFNDQEARRIDGKMPTPTLVVLDEAHYLAGASVSGRVQELARRIFVRIATEGRKYGVYLLLATQRPSLLDPTVLSQVQNVVLKTISSRADLDALEGSLTSVTPGLIEMLPGLDKAHAIVAGPFVRMPMLVRIPRPSSVLGGKDVKIR